MSEFDVLIVGAGPTGLSAAIFLTQLGMRCLVIDKKSEPTKTSNALAVQSRTLEIWEKLGILDEALLQGQPITGINIYSNKKQLGHISLQGLKAAYPYLLTLPQAQTEKILFEKFSALGGVIEREAEFTNLSQHSQGVDAVYLKNGVEIKLQIKWILGCDGTHSRVREVLNIPFLGKDLSQHFAMADLTIDGPLAPDRMHGFWSPQGVMAIFPMKNYCRLIAEISHDPELSQIKGAPSFEIFNQLMKTRSHFKVTLSEPLWTSSFWIHEHVVSQYNKGRIFLLGDAAHEHSPVGGQGMNTGIQDAYNLCWKLALVEKGQMEQKLLGSYEKERLPVAKALVNAATKATNIVTTRSLFLKILRLLALKCITHFSSLQNKIAGAVSELNINYANDGFVEEKGKWQNGVLPGWRIPFNVIRDKDQTISLQKLVVTDKYTVIIFLGKESVSKKDVERFLQIINNKYAHLIDILVITEREQSSAINTKVINDLNGILHQQFSALQPCYYLVRPDQYIGFRAKGLNEEALEAYLRKIGLKA